MSAIHYIKEFIDKRFGISLCISLANLAIGCIGIVWSDYAIPAAIAFAFSLCAAVRIIISRVGRIPFVVRDSLWKIILRRKSLKNYEDREARYKSISLTLGALWLSLSVISVTAYLAVELVAFLANS